MSRTIDTKVVEMRFDNKHFESNVATTLSTIEKLKQSLNFKDSSAGLENVASAARKCDMSVLSRSAEYVRLKFSALEVMAVTALANITNSAVNAGKRIVSALTIDPVKMGFQEYETKINAIQTIMSNTSSKGTTMDDVTTVLDELNTYADKTIYNFAEMTRNIGTFTAAGVGLEDSAAAIQGIANLAAASGSNSHQASTAMYQLSQALASGTVKLMDWNSVVNAGMGGQKFQEALKSTAREHGIAVDDMIKKHGSFRESLSTGWISADILNETLKKFTVEGAKEYAESMVKSGKYTQEQADALIKEAQAMEDAATKVKTFTQLWDTLKESAQSGWSQTWEIIIGDFEEAKSFLTEVSDTIGGIIGKSADARNEMLENWKVLGGRDDLLQSLRNSFEAISSVIKPISEAFRDIFPPITSEQMFAFTEGLKNLTEKLKIGEETADKIKRTFKGLFAVIDIVRIVIVEVFKAVGSLTGTVGELGGGILSVTANIGDWLVALRDSIKSSDIFNKVLQGIATAIKFAVKIIKNLVAVLGDTFSIFADVISRVGDEVSVAVDGIGSALEKCSIIKVLESLWAGIKTVATGIVEVINILAEGLGVSLDNGSIFDLLNNIIEVGVGVSLLSLFNTIKKAFGGVAEAIGTVAEVMDGFRGVLEAYQSKLRADALMKIAQAIAVLSASILILSFIDNDKLYDSIVALGVLFATLMGSLTVVAKFSGSFKNIIAASYAMSSVASAVLRLAIAMRIIGSLKPEQMASSVLSIAAMVFMIVKASKMLTTGLDEKAVIKGMTQMVIFSTAILILSSAMKTIGQLSIESVLKGIWGVYAMAGAMIATIKLLAYGSKNDTDVMKSASQMVIFAVAIKILASVCEDLSYLSIDQLINSLGSISYLMMILVVAAKVISRGNTKDVISGAMQMVLFAAAIKILASACEDLGNMSWTDLNEGLFGMIAVFTTFVLALKYMPKNTALIGAGLVLVATSLLIVAGALRLMGAMAWDEIIRGITTLALSLAVLTVALYAMRNSLLGAAALAASVGSIVVLTLALYALGAMSWSDIAKALTVLAGAFIIIGVAAYALSGVAPVILAIAGALALIGIAVLAAGAGLIAFGTGLTALAGGIIAIGASIGYICTGIIKLVSALIVGIIKGVGEGIIALCEVIINGTTIIGEALVVVITTLCDVLIKCVPIIVDTILKILLALLDSLVKYTPKIVDAIFNFCIGIIESLGKNIPKLVKAVVDLLMSLLSGVFDVLKNMDPDTILKSIGAVGLLAGVMAALAGVAALVPMAMVGVLGMGAVVAELALVLAAVGALAQIPGLKWLIGEGGNLLQKIGTAIGQFIGGIAQGFTSSLPQIGIDLSTFMTNIKPFIDGAKTIDPSTLDGVKSLVGIILALTGANIIERLTSWLTGGSSLTKFGEEIAAFGPCIRTYADSVAGIDSSAVEASATAAKALAEMTQHIPNEGGMIAWFAGENSIAKFGNDLVVLGQGLRGFSNSVAGINVEAMMTAATVAKSLAEMTSYIPNQGGVVAWFTGENSIAKFGNEIVMLGEGLKGFSDAIIGINPEYMIAAANAAKVLSDMTNSIPNEGGVAAWFSGENSISKFGEDIIQLGYGLKGFSNAIMGINPEYMTAAANAAKSLAEMTQFIPNQGGIVAWFTGDNSVSKFGTDLIWLGYGLKGFSDAIVGINPENLTAASNAAKSLAEMTSHIPNQNGVLQWFTGEASISKFAFELVRLGKGLKGFSDETTGINPETIVAAANAAKSLAELTSYLPNQNGVVQWFTGETSLSKFSTDMVKLGKGLKGFSESVDGLNMENCSAAANAAKSLAEMTQHIPKEGGIKAWFSGETSISNFASKLPTLGEGMKGFSKSVEGISPENVNAAANAAKHLSAMLSNMPPDPKQISKAGENLVKFSEKLKTYYKNIGGISEGSSTNASKALKNVKEISEINAGNISSVASALRDLTDSIKNMVKDIKDDLKKAGKEAVEKFIKGIKNGLGDAKKACKDFAQDCADAMGDKKNAFKTVGKELAQGFADGISEKTFKAEAQAKAMAEAAVTTARKALAVNSPSKVFRAIGTSIPEGFAMGIDKLRDRVINSSVSMANVAISGVKNSISKIANVINSDVDTQPTIRPVLDLSDVRTGAKAIGGLFGSEYVGVSANVSAISTMMNKPHQNGTNNDVVSAIDGLRGDIGKLNNTTYQIGDISYSDGSEVAEAIETIIRAIKVERRT